MRRVQLNENQLRRLVRSIIKENSRPSNLMVNFSYSLVDGEGDFETTHKNLMDELDKKFKEFGKMYGSTKDTLNFGKKNGALFAKAFASIDMSERDAYDTEIQKQILRFIEVTLRKYVSNLQIWLEFTKEDGKKEEIKNPERWL